MAWYQRKFSFTLDTRFGFGILFDKEEGETYRQCFYEDGRLAPAKDLPDLYGAVEAFRRYSSRENDYLSPSEAQNEQSASNQSSCTFQPGPDHSIIAILKTPKENVQVTSSKGTYYSFSARCNCKNRMCHHERDAADFLDLRLARLMHEYIISDLTTDKTVFLDPYLRSMIVNIQIRELNIEAVRYVRQILSLIRAANSEPYYWLFHNYLLQLDPAYDYSATFLQDLFTEVMLALFDDPGYQQTVLSTDHYAEPESYEGRQRRSNRTCLKRVLKEYQRAIKAMDQKNDYTEQYAKEFLLKYRNDFPGLFHYFAVGKEELQKCDLPFLAMIADQPHRPYDDLLAVAQKLDEMDLPRETGPVLESLTGSLKTEEKTELYSRLRNLSMPAHEIRSLSREDQLKMIRNTPISADSLRYIMDDLLAQASAEERGAFLLHAVNKVRIERNAELKNMIADYAAALPKNALLLRFVQSRLNINRHKSIKHEDPEKELSMYFHGHYEISRDHGQLYVYFTVTDPESEAILLDAIEYHGKLVLRSSEEAGYSAELIRKFCLAGKEDQYQEDFLQNKEALAAELFAQDHRKFSKEYQELCASLTDEKILFSDTEKVHIDWLLYREENANALAFKVGKGKMYIVKDATEFVRAFRTGETKEYGKDLILTHDTDNLTEEDAAILKFLMTAKFSKGRKSDPGNKRYITVSDALMGNILEHLAGRSVWFNEIPCQLRMESQKIRLRVNGKYELSTDISKKNQQFLNLLGKGYLLTHRSGKEVSVMDRVEGSAEAINLISLVERNPSVCIQPILPDFRKNIYSRFFELFDVDASVQKDFTLSSVRLNTYFDFDKNVITSRTSFLRDGKEITRDQLTDRIDRNKVELLDTYLQSLGFSDGVLSDESRILSFFKMDFTRMKTLTNVYLSDSLKNKELRSVGKPVIRVTYQNNLVNVFLEKSEFTESELEQIIAGLRKKRKYILLSGERIVDLDSETARDFGETVQDFGMDPKDLYQRKTISMVNAIKAFSHERSCRVDKYLRDMIEEIRSFKEADIPLPKLGAELRDYQADGFRWLSILSKYNMGGILADDMGLGKTIQMIALIKSDRTRRPSLVVCPKSLIFNWISEFARFDKTARTTAIYGPDSKRSELISAINYQEKAVYITSYDSLRNDIGKYTGEFHYAVLDEAQYIKNVNALKTKSVKELRACHRFALTGTPIENSVVDLWSIFDFIMPGYFEELSRFRDSETELIGRKAAPFILRRVKEDVLDDLPAKYERILSAEMSEKQRKLYDGMRMEARKAMEEGGKAFDMLPYLTRLRQICVDPGMFVENFNDQSGKMELLRSLIPEYLNAHHRILIFSQFVKALESVGTMLYELNIPSYFLSGATSAKDRIDMMDSFNNGSGTDVFLISLKAGGTGLNLTGADTVIHLDPWWNVAAENQASDRTHRIGQTRNVEVIKLIASDSIEQRVLELQNLKKEVIKKVISDDDGSVTSASLEDIAFILN